MTRPALVRALAATCLAAVLSQGIAATPAEASGQMSWTLAPSDPDAARALDGALRLYALGRNVRDGSIRQLGQNNAAGLRQIGRGQLGLIEQRGNRHSGTLTQEGEGNSYGLFQFGRGAEDHVVQQGRGRSGATFSYGW